MVTMCAWIFDIALSTVLNAERFDVGFYAGRLYGLSAATFILIVLLTKTSALYARLSRLLDAEQIERRRESAMRRRIFDTSLDLIFVADRHGNLMQVSPSSEAILGYRPEPRWRDAAPSSSCIADDLEQHTQRNAQGEPRLVRPAVSIAATSTRTAASFR